MPSHMDLLAQAVELDKKLDPETPVVSLNSGDFNSLAQGPEIISRSVSSPDLLARAAGMLGDSRGDQPGAADLLAMAAAHGEERNLNNERVRQRIARDWAREGTIREHPRPLGLLPVSGDTDRVANPVEGSNRDEAGGRAVGAQGAISKEDETPIAQRSLTEAEQANHIDLLGAHHDTNKNMDAARLADEKKAADDAAARAAQAVVAAQQSPPKPTSPPIWKANA